MKKTMIVAIAILAIVLGIVAYASAAGNTVNVTAKVNPKLTMSVNDTAVFGLAAGYDPGVLASDSSSVDVQSNMDFAMSWVDTDLTVLGITHAVKYLGTPIANDAGAKDYVKGPVRTFTDDFAMTVPWDLDPGTYTGTVVYTATQ